MYIYTVYIHIRMLMNIANDWIRPMIKSHFDKTICVSFKRQTPSEKAKNYMISVYHLEDHIFDYGSSYHFLIATIEQNN